MSGYVSGMSRSENERSSTASTSPTTPEVDNTPKPKKFFKSRNTEPPDLEAAPPTGGRASKRAKITYDEKPTRGSPRKFFSHKANSPPDKSTVLTQNVNTSKQKQEVKPPIVLRICRGDYLFYFKGIVDNWQLLFRVLSFSKLIFTQFCQACTSSTVYKTQ